MLLELGEETDSWPPLGWADLGFEWMVKKVPIPEEGVKESELSEKEEGRLSEVDESCFALWRNNAEIKLDVDLVQEDDDWIAFQL